MCKKIYSLLLALIVVAATVSAIMGEASAQTFPQQVPQAALNAMPGSGPSNPLAPPLGPFLGPGGSDTFNVSSGLFRDLFPTIPNLEFGFNYMFGSKLRQSRWSLDYLLPMGFGPDSTLFAEAHGESVGSKSSTWVPFLNNFWQQKAPGDESRLDLSFGIGYRRIFSEDFLLGINTFYDTTRLYGTDWRSSGGYGLEMAANGPGDSAIDLTFNYYGNVYGTYNSRGSVFPTFNIVDGLQNGTANYDVEAGYSQSILDQAFDLRVKFTGYQFALNNSKKYGIKSGAEITTADGVFRLSAEGGQDGVMGSYGTVGAYVNVGVQLERLFYGQNPFTLPEPVFKSPRNLRRLLARPVHRNWFKPATVVANANCEGCPDDSQFAVPEDKACFYAGGKTQCKNPPVAGVPPDLSIIAETAGQHWVEWYVTAYPTTTGPPPNGPYDYHGDVEPMWICASAAYARAAEGVVYAMVSAYWWNNHNHIWWQTELPTLRGNPNVDAILVYSDVNGFWQFMGDFR